MRNLVKIVEKEILRFCKICVFLLFFAGLNYGQDTLMWQKVRICLLLKSSRGRKMFRFINYIGIQFQHVRSAGIKSKLNGTALVSDMGYVKIWKDLNGDGELQMSILR